MSAFYKCPCVTIFILILISRVKGQQVQLNNVSPNLFNNLTSNFSIPNQNPPNNIQFNLDHLQNRSQNRPNLFNRDTNINQNPNDRSQNFIGPTLAPNLDINRNRNLNFELTRNDFNRNLNRPNLPDPNLLNEFNRNRNVNFGGNRILQFGRDYDPLNYGGGYYDPFFRLQNESLFVKYLAIAPAIIQPDSVYSAVVTIISSLNEIEAVDVWLSLAKDGVDLQGSNKLISVGESDTLQIQIPRRLTTGEYKIRLEGNYPGSQGGTLFLNETTLTFSEKFLSILIQTNRYVFNGGQKVMFRIILLQRNLLPFGDNVEVYILDARGFIMRRWPSVASNFGVVDLIYELPPYTNLGKWRIRVEAGTQTEEKEFLVEKYFQPQYETYVSLPPFILNTEELLSAGISGFYGSEKTVRGNATVSLYAFSYESRHERFRNNLPIVPGILPGFVGPLNEYQRDYIYIGSQFLYLNGEVQAYWNLREVMAISRFSKLGLRVEADVTEFFLEEPRFGFAETRVIQEQLELRFLKRSPLIFKPGLPFEVLLQVSYKDLERVSPEILSKSRIRVFPQVVLERGGSIALESIEVNPEGFTNVPSYYNDERDAHLVDNFYRFKPINEKMEDFYGHTRNIRYWKDGILQIKFLVPKGAARLSIQADYSDEIGNTATANTFVYSTYSPNQKYISVSTTSRFGKVNVGEFVVLSVNANFKMDHFHWIVQAKGLILQQGREIMQTYWSLPRSLSIAVSTEMSPGFRVIVYHSFMEQEFVSDSIFIPVDEITRHKIELRINDVKDRKRDTLEFTYLGEPAAYFASSAQRSVREFMQAGNELTKKSVLETLHSLEFFNKSIHRVTRRSRSGEEADSVEYFPSMNYGVDSNRTMNYSGLLIFTNLDVPILPAAEYCREDEERCATEGCYYIWQKCDGQYNCGDQTDEEDCEELDEEDIQEFRVHRISRFLDFYDPDDGDWAWHKENIAHGGDYILTRDVPKITDSWHIHAFAVSKTNGFAFVPDPIYFETSRLFMMALDAPSQIKRGEQVGIFAILYNKMDKDIFAWVVLKGSDDYEMVQVGEAGSFNFKNPEDAFTSGDHQHFVWIPANSELEVRFAIRPTIDQGTIEVNIEATTQMRSDSSSVEIEVMAEGVQIAKHTSLLLDLKNRAVVLKFMDIFTEETPIIPYELQRKYVFGSPAGHVTLTGDVLGPIFPEENVGMTMSQMIGRSGKGTADRVFDMAANVWGLHYLRLTNKLPNSHRRRIFVEINKIFAHIMKRFRPGGYFKMWNVSKPSVWLSAWVIQIFRHASFQDWENEFFVEPRIFTLVAKWLLRYQNFDGSFRETMWYQRPLHKMMANNQLWSPNGPFNISLTAHIAITLQEVLPFLEGGLRVDASIAKQRAVQYLETYLTKLDNPYELAITSYALTLCDSAEKELAYGLLNQRKIDDQGFIYWAPDIIPVNTIIWENNRPFIQPKNNEYWDSLSVEASSYALLVYLIREGVTLVPEKIVAWLNSMRLTDGAFISTVDTSIALQALCEYANRARLREITQMEVLMEVASASNLSGGIPLEVNFDNIDKTQTLDLQDTWGHVNVIARGSGQAVVQLDLTYGVDWAEFKDTPPKECFELRVREIFSERRNKSSVTYEACFRWTLTEESEVSGAAVLEVEIPSGYGMIQADAIEVVTGGAHPLLRDALMEPSKTSWYFDYIPSYETCFTHTVNRWYPVANLTTHKSAIIYEAYAPERFEIFIWNDTSLRDLDICQVCGSYQCPYCPFYSSSPPHLNLDSIIFISSFLLSCLILIR